MLIDQYLPRFDVTEVHEIEVDASPEATYKAIRTADLRDPLIDTLFAVRELPNRIARRLHGSPQPSAQGPVTFGDLGKLEMGWVPLGDEPGVEFVVGSVGRFWRKDYGWRPVEPDAFTEFSEPGYGKIAISFQVRPGAPGRAVLRYEARTATTDQIARTRFGRYWRIIRPGVGLVMRRALARIRTEAERQQQHVPLGAM